MFDRRQFSLAAAALGLAPSLARAQAGLLCGLPVLPAGCLTELPDWADYDALPPGTFREFTLNRPQDVGMPRATMANWCGGVFVPDYGQFGAACYFGGGEHYVWTDSTVSGKGGQQGVYVLDCAERRYFRACYPLANHKGVAGGKGSPTDEWGAYLDDGSPQSKHTYNCISYAPALWGLGLEGALMSVGKSGGAFAPSETPVTGLSATWALDLSKQYHAPDDPAIRRLTGNNTYDYGSGQPARINDASMACIDLVRQGWWSSHRSGTSSAGNRMAFTSKDGIISPPQGKSLPTKWSALHHFADDDIIVRICDDRYSHNVAVPVWQVWVWQAGTETAWVQAPVVRQDIADVMPSGIKAYPPIGYIHPRWSEILGCFVGLDYWYPRDQQPTTTIRVWRVKPPPAGSRFTGTWEITWELVRAVPGSETNVMNMTQSGDDGAVNGCFGRFVECPSLRAFVWTRDASMLGQLVRLQGM